VSGLISIIITTYNREDALDAVLRSLEGQKDQNFEVLVADDGSSPTTAALTRRWKARIGASHACGRHRGFRAGEIRNRAVCASRGDSCSSMAIASRGPISRAHRRFAEPGWFVTGNRALLTRH
jgi:glycosyltransferase involved in cell wall biosynthesis